MSVQILAIIERIIIVAGGILSVWCGYKLFFIAEMKPESSGKFSSRIFDVSLTKVTPGVFFALFGVFVLVTGLYRPIQIGQSIDTVALKSEALRLSEDINKLPDEDPNKGKLRADFEQLSKVLSKRDTYGIYIGKEFYPDTRS
jgi:hypothetical protein